MKTVVEHKNRPWYRLKRRWPRERFDFEKCNNTLIVTDYGGYETRNKVTIETISEAIVKHSVPDFTSVRVNTGDQPCDSTGMSKRVLSFSTTSEHYDIAVPDFLFGGWPEVGIDDYDWMRKEIERTGRQPAELPKLGWIGNCDTHPNRWKFHEIAQGNAAMDVFHTGWKIVEGQDRLKATHCYISLPELVQRYEYLIDIEGAGYSARLKLLLFSGRPVLIQERPWREYFFDNLVPFEHYIPIMNNLTDLEEQFTWANENPEECQRIAANALLFARKHLTREAALKHFASVLRNLAERS